MQEFAGRTLIWSLSRSDWAEKFDRILVMRGGRVVEQGSYDELKKKKGSALNGPIAAE